MNSKVLHYWRAGAVKEAEERIGALWARQAAEQRWKKAAEAGECQRLKFGQTSELKALQREAAEQKWKKAAEAGEAGGFLNLRNPL